MCSYHFMIWCAKMTEQFMLHANMGKKQEADSYIESCIFSMHQGDCDAGRLRFTCRETML